MRIQCKLLSLFLLGLVVTASIVEASRKKRYKKKKGKKAKDKHSFPTSILLDDTSIAESEVPVPQVSKTSDSSSLLSLDFSSVDRNELSPSSLSQVSTASDFSFLNLSLDTGFVSLSSTLKLESPKQKDRKINIDNIHSSSSSSSSLSSATESGVKEDVIKAVDEDGFESINDHWEKWRNRDDLFDYV